MDAAAGGTRVDGVASDGRERPRREFRRAESRVVAREPRRVRALVALGAFLMERRLLTARVDWREKAERIGFTYHTHETGAYWDESVHYVFSAREIDELEAAGNTLHALC